MTYVVNWQRADGGHAWHPVGEVQEAATFAEHLRNAEGVEATRIYRLEEVAFAFKPYFRVELARDEVAPAVAPEPAPEPVQVAAPVAPSHAAPSPVAVAASAEVADANGTRRGLFGR